MTAVGRDTNSSVINRNADSANEKMSIFTRGVRQTVEFNLSLIIIMIVISSFHYQR